MLGVLRTMTLAAQLLQSAGLIRISKSWIVRITGLFPPENAIDIRRGAPIEIDKFNAV